MHVRQTREWVAYGLACHIDESAAIQATSWGLGQILGSAWQRCGYESVAAFRLAQNSIAKQQDTLRRFVEGDPHLVSALTAHDWHEVALRYNGSGQAAWYADRLAAAYERAGRLA
jgi:hypothetical protein